LSRARRDPDGLAAHGEDLRGAALRGRPAHLVVPRRRLDAELAHLAEDEEEAPPSLARDLAGGGDRGAGRGRAGGLHAVDRQEAARQEPRRGAPLAGASGGAGDRLFAELRGDGAAGADLRGGDGRSAGERASLAEQRGGEGERAPADAIEFYPGAIDA